MANSSKTTHSTYPPSYTSSAVPSTAYSSYSLSPSSIGASTMQAPPPTTPPKGSASFSIDTIAVDPHQPPEPYPSFPNNLPPRAKHDPAARPSFFRFLWYIRPGAYSLRKLSADTRHGMVARIRWRRICMIWIVLMRVGISAEISLAAYWEQWLLITYIVFSVVGFWSILACLTNIGDAEGTRRELGMDIGRKWLDVFLYVMAALNTIICGLWIIMAYYESAITATLWLVLWIVTFVVAWMAAQPADQSRDSYLGA